MKNREKKEKRKVGRVDLKNKKVMMDKEKKKRQRMGMRNKKKQKDSDKKKW